MVLIAPINTIKSETSNLQVEQSKDPVGGFKLTPEGKGRVYTLDEDTNTIVEVPSGTTNKGNVLEIGEPGAIDPQTTQIVPSTQIEEDIDIVHGVVNSENVQSQTPEVTKLIEESGNDAEYTREKNTSINLEPENTPHQVTETTLLKDDLWIESAKKLMPLFKQFKPAYRGDTPTDPMQVSQGSVEVERQSGSEPTDEEAAQWGLEMMGWFNYNLPSMAMNTNRIQSGDSDQKMALYYLMNMYDQKEIDWNGSKRMFLGMIADPTTYLGLATLGIGTVVGASVKAASKTSIKAALKAALMPMLAGSAESAFYTGADDAMRQAVSIMAGAQLEFDPLQSAVSTGVGAAAGATLVGIASTAVPLAKKGINAFEGAVQDAMGGKLGMGVGPTGKVTLPPSVQEKFNGSAILDEDGSPLIVYRGEHGGDAGGFNTNLGSLTFSKSKYVAGDYAADGPEARVNASVLDIKNPIQLGGEAEDVVTFRELLEKLDPQTDAEKQLFREMIEHPHNNWRGYDSSPMDSNSRNANDPVTVEELMEADGSPDFNRDTPYTDTFTVVDREAFTELAKLKGYDGAVYRGAFTPTDEAGVIPSDVANDLEMNGEIEYRPFDESQVHPAYSDEPLPAPQVEHAIPAEADNPNSIINMLYNNAERSAVTADTKVVHPDGGRWTKARLAAETDKQAKLAKRTVKEYNEVTREQLSNSVANEAVAALQKQGNASDWYNTKLIEMNDHLQKLHPEMKPGTAEEGVFKLGLSLTSNGSAVDYNLKSADHIYSVFKKTGKYPTDLDSLTVAVGGFGKEGPTLIKHMARANDLIDDLGPQGFADFLNTKTTVKELKAKGFNLSGESDTYETYGSAIFGPKIGGGFYQNLRGNFDPVTFDRWWMASWGRWTGNARLVIPEKTKLGHLKRFQAAVIGTGGKQLSQRAANLRAAGKIYRKYVKDGYKPRTELNTAAQRLVEGEKVIMREQPGGPTERSFMREVAYESVAKLKTMGYDVTPADLQATVWYPEKDLHGSYKIGNGSSAPDDYAAAAKRLLESRNGK